jgi:hypothetical protein
MRWIKRTSEYLIGFWLVMAQLALDGRAVAIVDAARLD